MRLPNPDHTLSDGAEVVMMERNLFANNAMRGTFISREGHDFSGGFSFHAKASAAGDSQSSISCSMPRFSSAFASVFTSTPTSMSRPERKAGAPALADAAGTGGAAARAGAAAAGGGGGEELEHWQPDLFLEPPSLPPTYHPTAHAHQRSWTRKQGKIDHQGKTWEPINGIFSWLVPTVED